MITVENIKKSWDNLKPFRCLINIPTLYVVKDIPWEYFVQRLIECGAIPKKNLIDGKKYIGDCRNAHIATWNEEKQVFTYRRRKFGYEYDEDINHFEDDNGYDLFVPVWEYEPKELNKDTVLDWITKEFNPETVILPPDNLQEIEEIEKWAKETYQRRFLNLGLEEYLERKEK